MNLDLVDVARRSCSRTAFAHLGLAVRDRADHADAASIGATHSERRRLSPVAAGLGDVVAGDEHPRPGIDAFVDRLAKSVVGAAGVAHGREPLRQALLGSTQRLRGQQARRQIAMLVGDVALDRADVDMRRR